MVKAGLLDFNKNNGSSVTTNMLPNHTDPNVNAIVEDSSLKVKTKVDEVKVSMEKVYKVMVRVGAIPINEVFNEEKRKQSCFCRYHEACVDHTVQNYEEFRGLIKQ